MRKLFTILVSVLLTATLWAQSPEKMSYQAVIRNSSNNLVTNTAVGMQISILEGSASGTAVYVETQPTTTNANGLVSIEIGDGTVQTGTFATIDWANGPYFIKTETDPTGGTSYTITGTSQLLSVPYALHAKTADSISNIAQKVVMTTGNQIVSGGKTFVNGFNTHYIEVNSFNSGNRNAFIDFHGDDTYTDYSLRLARYSNGKSILEHRGTETFSIQATDAASIWFSTNGQERMIIDAVGSIDMKNSQVMNVKTPVNNADAVNKAYVDAKIQTLTIGQAYQGGKIFWLDATGQHGLIAATADQSTGIQWYNGSFTTTNAIRDGIGAGMFNTERIISNQGVGAYAAQLCANYQSGGYGDWYLPSKYELNLLYQQKTAVGGFASDSYWSSTEGSNTSAWNQGFDGGSQGGGSKSLALRVRAVRAF